MKHSVRVAISFVLVSLTFLQPIAAQELPEVSVTLPSAPVHPGKMGSVVYTLRWQGALDEWRIPAPVLTQPEWGKIAMRSTKTYWDIDSTVIEFEVGVIADQPGAFDLPSLEFNLFTSADLVKNESAPLKEAPPVWIATAAVTSEPVTMNVVPDYRRLMTFGGIAGGAAMALLIAGAVVYRRKPARSVESAPVATDDPRDHVHAARKHRLDGDFYGFYQALGRAAGMAGGVEAVKLAAQFKERAREVGYSGVRPTDDDLDAALKDVERTLAAHRG